MTEGINTKCACGRSFKANPELAGRRVKCPECGDTLIVPDLKPKDESLRVPCSCGKILKAKGTLAGKRVRCPACGEVLVVPVGQQATPPDVDGDGFSDFLSTELAAAQIKKLETQREQDQERMADENKAESPPPPAQRKWKNPLKSRVGRLIIGQRMVAFGILAYCIHMSLFFARVNIPFLTAITFGATLLGLVAAFLGILLMSSGLEGSNQVAAFFLMFVACIPVFNIAAFIIFSIAVMSQLRDEGYNIIGFKMKRRR